MTLGVCQGRSSIASFSILTSASRGPSAIAEPLVFICNQLIITSYTYENFCSTPLIITTRIKKT